jgi:16S rRNA (guanine966-N2)-methyltransferase
MRIVGGRHRGRRLEAPGGLTLRPTADRTREALFNSLCQGKLDWRPKGLDGDGGAPGGNPLVGAAVLDAFAGTGALGLEALSRGAGLVSFMENQAAALNACQTNIETLGEAEHGKLLRCDVLRPPKAVAPCVLVLMDPPYNQDLAPPALAALQAAGWLAPGALATVELMASEPFTPPGGFETLDERKYGKARLVFLRAPQ